MKPAIISAIFRRLSAPILAVVLLTPGTLAADEVASPAVLAAVAASGNLMNVAVYDALLSAGASEFQARAAAQSVADTDHLATKADIADLRSDLILTGAATAFAVVLMIVAGFHLLWRRISELAERLPHAAA